VRWLQRARGCVARAIFYRNFVQDDGDVGGELPKPCAHDEKHCRRCGGCFRRKCCACPGAPTLRPYKKRQIVSNASSSADAAPPAVAPGREHASGCVCAGDRCRNLCLTCSGCNRECGCKEVPAMYASLLRAAKVPDTVESDDNGEKQDGPPAIPAPQVPNPLYDAAVALGLDARTLTAAKRSHATRLSTNISELPERDRQYLMQALGGNRRRNSVSRSAQRYARRVLPPGEASTRQVRRHE